VAHRRALEAGEKAGVQTGFLKWGDSLRVDLKGADGQSVFGAIDLDVLNLTDPDPQEAAAAAALAAQVEAATDGQDGPDEGAVDGPVDGAEPLDAESQP
jgi:fumarylacetoacetate (FAA) hydrolase